MEEIRKKLMRDGGMYSDLHAMRKNNGQSKHGPRSSSPDIITIASSTGSVEDEPVPAARRPAVVGRRVVDVSSDDEDDGDQNIAPARVPSARIASSENAAMRSSNVPLKQRDANDVSHSVANVLKGVPIPVPSNPPVYPGALPSRAQLPEAEGEVFNFAAIPGVNMWEPRRTTAETERELRELMEGGVGETDGEIDMSEAVVEGFQAKVRLLPHQVQGRLWMRERETGKKLGGILADDMGLGKTIQTVARIVEGRAKKSDQKDGWAATTLVVCPVALVAQWAEEIRKYTKDLKVIEHHGQNRTTDPLRLQRAHVVVTSYSIVSSEHSVYEGDAKDEGSKKGKKAATKKKGSRSDNSDSDELDSGSDSSSGFGRTVKKKASAGKKKNGKDALFRVKWFRIVLDEAHTIKNRNTKAALACCALDGKYRWCLTGTPMQNTVEELYSLFKFLRIRPLNDWQHFDETINKPIKQGRTNVALKRLQVVLRTIMLRRRKDQTLDGKPLLKLPDRTVTIESCEFDEEEREFYRLLETKMSDSLDRMEQADQIKNSYTSVLTMLLRLRQACNHQALVTKSFTVDIEALEPKPVKNADDDDGDELAGALNALTVSGGQKCQLCQAVLTSSNRAPDGDDDSSDLTLCKDCVKLETKARRASIRPNSNLPQDSAKTRKILELLRLIDDRGDGEEKTIIFSQFTSMLDILEHFLKAECIKFVRYDGSMAKDARDASLEKLRRDASVRCILISLKAGGTGLNLTSCNNVILVDLWWNPALEDQAFDRAHRFGQTRDVNIYKLVIDDTVEQRILALQDKKRELAKAALSGDKLEKMKLGVEDLLALFRRDFDDDE